LGKGIDGFQLVHFSDLEDFKVMTLISGEPSQSSQGSSASRDSGDAGRTASPDSRLLPMDVTKNLVEVFKLLADETRLQVLFLLQQKRELNVRALCHLLKQSQPAVSHHLALLRVAGLIEMRRDGKHNFYRLIPQRFEEVADMIFASTPGDRNQIRFNDNVISYTQAK
jgi:ArsR family transcriptional regulator, arsenate/arsenite/antimonite-responsive transcriptional repressor